MRRPLEHWIEDFQTDGDGVRWVPTEHLHLTLQFLGDVDDVDTAAVCDAAATAAASIEPFSVVVKHRDVLPSMAKPRTLIAAVDDPANTLCQLVRRLRTEFADLGFRPEQRDYRPHITLGRPRGGGRRIQAEVVSRWTDEPEPLDKTVEVNEIAVIASVLDRAGPTYHRLTTIGLG